MKQSEAYKTLIQNESTLKIELLKSHDENTTSQILHHYEKTGAMPNGKELAQTMSHITQSLEHFSPHQTDKIFTHALPKEDQKQIRFEKQNQLEK